MVAYYNEIDPKAAAWLRELTARGLIAPGDVDERSIEDVRPSELAGYTQCHFFAGIGVWSYALRQAGWPDDRPVWTGSCPCQPFSAAGKGGGFDDERHLWPAFHWLIDQRRPPVVLGEQVASKDGLAWLDLVQADLEGTGYAVGAVDTCAAGFGAPHIRQRLYWVADAMQPDFGRRRISGPGESDSAGTGPTRQRPSGFRATSGLADDDDARLEGRRQSGRERAVERPAGASGVAGGMADTDGGDASEERQQRSWEQRQQSQDGGAGWVADDARSGWREERPNAGGLAAGDRSEGLAAGLGTSGSDSWPGPTNGLWRDVDWLFCRDGKWRPVEPGTFPLAHGAPTRVGRLRGYGNAINAAQAQGFIEAYLGVA